MMSGRRPIHAGFYHHRFGVCADPDGVPAELALDHPFGGVGITFFEASRESGRDALLAALEDRMLPASIGGSKASICIGLTPTPLPEDAPSYVKRPEGLDRRVLLLSFFSGEPGAALREWTQRLASDVEAESLGRLELAAPFIPTVPGTDRYADDLW